MGTRILLVGARLCRNLGGPSLLDGTLEVLNAHFGNPTYTYITPVAEDAGIVNLRGTEVQVLPLQGKQHLLWPTLMKLLIGVDVGSPSVRGVVDAFRQADVVIDLFGIMFCDALGRNRFLSRAIEGFHFLAAKVMGKTVIKYTADLGPFAFRWNRLFARFYLQRTVDLILARNEESARRLKALKISTPIHVVPDTAFLLLPSGSSFVQQMKTRDRPIVGLSISHKAARESGDTKRYVTAMAVLADHVVEQFGAKVLMIPNEIANNSAVDDRYFCALAHSQMSHRSEVILAPEDCSASELKGIIGECEAVVASRYHTLVAALSQGAPVLAVGWHSKYPELLRMFGLEACFLDVGCADEGTIRCRFDRMWSQKDKIRIQIETVLPDVRNRILQAGELVRKTVGNPKSTAAGSSR